MPAAMTDRGIPCQTGVSAPATERNGLSMPINREYRTATHCAHRSRWRRCGQPAIGMCQYCGGGFCTDHGEQFNVHEEVCARSRCQAKKADLAAHLEFRASARQRNATALCGEPACATPPHARCERCTAEYCAQHLQQQEITDSRSGEMRMAILCRHCRSRIPLWTKT